MRFTWIIVTVAAIVAVYIYIRVSISRVFFKFDLSSIDLSKLKNQQKIDIIVLTSVENLNAFQIRFSDLYFELKYKDTLVGSSKQKDTKEYTVPEKGVLSFNEDVTINVTPDLISLLGKVALKQTVRIDYSVDLKVFGIKIIPTITDYFNLP